MRAPTRVRDHRGGGFREWPSRGGSNTGSSCFGASGRVRAARGRRGERDAGEGAGPGEAAAVRGAAATGRRRDRDPDPAPRAAPSTRSAAKFLQLRPPLSGGARGPGRREGAGARGAGSAALPREWPGSRAPSPGPARPRARRLPARRRRPSSSNFAGRIEIPPQLRPSICARPRPSPRARGPRSRARPSAPASPSLLPLPLPPFESGSEARPPLCPLPPEAPLLAGPPRRRLGCGADGGRGTGRGEPGCSEAQEGVLEVPPCPSSHPVAAGPRAALWWGSARQLWPGRATHDPRHVKQSRGALRTRAARPTSEKARTEGRRTRELGGQVVPAPPPQPWSPSFAHSPQPRGDPGKLSHTPLSLTLTICVPCKPRFLHVTGRETESSGAPRGAPRHSATRSPPQDGAFGTRPALVGGLALASGPAGGPRGARPVPAARRARPLPASCPPPASDSRPQYPQHALRSPPAAGQFTEHTKELTQFKGSKSR